MYKHFTLFTFRLFNSVNNITYKYKNKLKKYGEFEAIDLIPKINNQKNHINKYTRTTVPYKDQYESRDF